MFRKTAPWLLVLLAAILFIGLLSAPRLPAEKRALATASPADREIARAVALVENGQNPMEGIMILREVLEKDSTNVDAHWHLAQFSLTSRQIENAAFRFEKVLQYDDNQKYPEAYFWLAQSKVALDKPQEALPLLKKYLTLTSDTIVTKAVEKMIVNLENDSINVLN